MKNKSYARMFFVDINGNPKNIIVPYKKNLKIGFDGSSINGFSGIEKSDLFLSPDLESCFQLPWDNKDLKSFFCSIHHSNDEIFECDTRSLLKKKLEEFKKKGYTFNLASELEFFLLKENNGKYEILEKAEYCDISPFDTSEKFRLDFAKNLEKSGFKIEKIHHEVSNSQHEIGFEYDDALKTADRILLYKLICKQTANEHGSIASFMPKPFFEKNGSGAHVHISVIKDGKNIFVGEDSNPSKEMKNFIAGILNHSKALSLVLNPTINSYKRLIPGYEAPCYISWGRENRSCLIRIPAVQNANSLRIEYRQPDPSFNPYLAFTAIITAGMDGIERKLDPGHEMKTNVYKLNKNIETLPRNLAEAIEEFEKDTVIKNGLGDFLSSRLIDAKKKEWKEYLDFIKDKKGNEIEFRKKVTEWEIERYLLRS